MTLKTKFSIIFTTFISIITLVALCSAALLMSSTTYAKDHDDYKENQMMLLALKSSQTSLDTVIATFKADYPSIVTEIELDEEDNILMYEIKGIDLEEGTRYKAHYALHNGEKISNYSKSLRFMGFNKLDDHDLAALETVKNQGISIQDAIALTNLPEGSYIESIELERKRGLTFYEVKSIGPSGSTKILIDAKSGEIVPSLRR
ncbi:PepSY domain-containing protein [Marinomonas shanghaiensis]|uniref:PepSY domain-containing protein n=1 Tax=Marinomonas shanghaiensis TaxID=2202418 RepID=UPI000DBA3A2D|nr:PepSY domain-containing protein [Marinomonas shanghaiensis]